MAQLFENESYAPIRPMNTKELKALYGVKHGSTWKKMISSIAWKLISRKVEGRQIYTIREVEMIFEHLGRPIFIKDQKK